MQQKIFGRMSNTKMMRHGMDMSPLCTGNTGGEMNGMMNQSTTNGIHLQTLNPMRWSLWQQMKLVVMDKKKVNCARPRLWPVRPTKHLPRRAKQCARSDSRAATIQPRLRLERV